MLKRAERRNEARLIWQEIVENSGGEGVEAHIELAKHYEWHETDLTLALHWTEQALVRAFQFQSYNFALQEEIEHRRQRLRRKLGLDR